MYVLVDTRIRGELVILRTRHTVSLALINQIVMLFR
jgi:hypothetical protein